jgi:hypothetical protein
VKCRKKCPIILDIGVNNATKVIFDEKGVKISYVYGEGGREGGRRGSETSMCMHP